MTFRRMSKTGIGMFVIAASVVFLACPKPQPELELALSPATVDIDEGETGVVTATVTLDGEAQEGVTVAFESGDESVATVSPASDETSAGGVVQATVSGELEGNTTVTATADGASASTAVTVTSPPPVCVTHNVTLEGIAFVPAALTIKACDTVTWEHNDGGVPHTVTSGDCPGDTCTPDGIFDSSGGDPGNRLGQDDTFSHTFDDPGTFPYHCRVHVAGMQGTITVDPNP